MSLGNDSNDFNPLVGIVLERSLRVELKNYIRKRLQDRQDWCDARKMFCFIAKT